MKTKTLKVFGNHMLKNLFSVKTRGFRKVYLHLWCWGYSWLSSFWNGAVVIAALLVLFVMAVFSKHRLQYLIMASITVVLAYCQTQFFVKSGGSVVSPSIYIGFLANTNGLEQDLSRYFANNGLWATLEHFFKLIPYVTAFYIELLGLLPFIVAINLLSRNSKYKYHISLLFIAVTQVIGYFFIKYKLDSDDKIINKQLFTGSMLFALLLVVFACMLSFYRFTVISFYKDVCIRRNVIPLTVKV